ncbi:uncharacterized protein LOC141853055 isoform X2 [Brevipalpus obovatus]|uniref:uncharacterized protein LOC141853055 isoform X2 n=1 Tax=Brevipalpus obovatus TaxID=246614 RepID=UPI003D9F5BB4
MAQSEVSEEDIKHGKVQQVNHHYEGNRFKHQVFRNDREKAKYLQEQEEYERRLKVLQEQEILAHHTAKDESIARTIQEEEARRAQEIKLIEAEDAKLAQRLQAKEKERLRRRRLQKERLQVEKIRLEKFGSSCNPNLLEAVNQTLADIEQGEDKPSTSGCATSFHEEEDEYVGDLSDFCAKPPPGLDEDELKVFMAEQDEELARFLQQYETKRKTSLLMEKKQSIEAQDYEIARILQEEEKNRVKRLRERRRLMRDRKNAEKLEAANRYHINGSSGTIYHVAEINTQTETHNGEERPLYSEGELDQSSSTISTLVEYEEYDYDLQNENDREGDAGADDDDDSPGGPVRRALPPIPTFHNVAMDLDPTFKRKSKNKAKQSEEKPKPPSPDDADPTGVHFAQLCLVTTSSPAQDSQNTLSNHATSTLKRDMSRQNDSEITVFPDFDGPMPPILPVQGHRRSSTAQKKKKKTKETCRTQ